MRRAVDHAGDSRGARHERTPGDRSEERHAGDHRGIEDEPRAVAPRQLDQRRPVVSDERLVRADDGDAATERRRHQRARRLDAAQHLDDDVDVVPQHRVGVGRQGQRRTRSLAGDVAHERAHALQIQAGVGERRTSLTSERRHCLADPAVAEQADTHHTHGGIAPGPGRGAPPRGVTTFSSPTDTPSPFAHWPSSKTRGPMRRSRDAVRPRGSTERTITVGTSQRLSTQMQSTSRYLPR